MSCSNMTEGVDTYYKEYSCARWNYWTYCEGRRYSISEKQVLKAVKQGGKLVIVKQSYDRVRSYRSLKTGI